MTSTEYAIDLSSLARSSDAGLAWTYADRLARSRAAKAEHGVGEDYLWCQGAVRRVVEEFARRGLAVPAV